jgi:hypothetical protein
MIPVVITATPPARWWRLRRVKTWRRRLPERWSDLPEPLRRLYYGFLLNAEQGMPAVLRHCLRLPRWAFLAMRAEEVAALAGTLAWMQPEADCDTVPFPYFEYKGFRYYFPLPKGENLTCLEYPLADEYYMSVVQQGNDTALLLLLATICREQSFDHARVLREDDHRVPLNSRAEVTARANRLRGVPAEYQMAALLFFAGLKAYVHRVYGQHIFEIDDDEEEEEEDDAGKKKPAPEADAGFGWWGVMQDVAEARLFGTMKDVYQASFHEVCMWLVRQRIKERQMRAAYNAPPTTTNNFD